MAVRRHTIDITTDGSGNATVYSPIVSGIIQQIAYVKDGGANPFANGVDFTITLEATGENVWTQADVNASAVVAPRQPTHSQAGVAALYAAGGTGVFAAIGVSRDRVKFAIAQGGATKVGRFYLVMVDS